MHFFSRIAALGLVVMSTACGETPRGVPDGGPSIYVVFDERHDLEGDELVRLHEFDIGIVEGVVLHEARVRTTLRLAPDALNNLTTATTFTVNQEDGVRYLETYVLDPDADALSAGATLEGADGSIELLAMRASAATHGAVSSKWWEEASGWIDTMHEELDAIDWSEEENELREQWERAIEQTDQAVDEGREALEEHVDELVKKLEDAGRSDEARKLRERFEEFLNELR